MPDIVLLVIIFVVAIAFGASNGFNDAANAVAASIGSRAIRPRNALILAAIFNLAGALMGTAVAKTIGKGILTPEVITYQIVLAAVTAAVIWTFIASYKGLPISVSHSLVSGLVGAGLATVSTSDIGWGKFYTTMAAVVVAPSLGFIGAFILMVILLRIFFKLKPGFNNNVFRKGQWLTTAFLSYAHGKNDGQMPIGLMVMGLVIYYNDPGIWNSIPIWVILIAGASISLGTALGGWRVIKTMGFKVTALQPIHGFAAETSAAGVIELASHFGIPVSTTHCGVATVVGVGATSRLSAVRWGVARSIVLAWILTFPVCLGLGYVLGKLFTM